MSVPRFHLEEKRALGSFRSVSALVLALSVMVALAMAAVSGAILSPTGLGRAQVADYTYGQGYVMAGSDGGVFSFGGAPFYGSVYTFGHGSAEQWWGYPIVGVADATNYPYNGYWLVSSNGVVCNFGVSTEAGGSWQYPGNGCWQTLTNVTDIVGIVPTKDDQGYWLVGSDGGVFAFGDAAFLGSVESFGHGTADQWWGSPVVGITAAPVGSANGGYWLMSSNGVVCDFGVYTEAGGVWEYPGNGCWASGLTGVQDLVGGAPSVDGQGLWLDGSDGGVFAFGDAPFRGSLGGTQLPEPIVGMAATVGGDGYWEVGSDGGVMAFGGAQFLGGMSGATLGAPIVGIAAT